MIPPSLETSIATSDRLSQKFDIASTSLLFLERARRVYASVVSPTDTTVHAVPRLLDVFTADPSSSVEKFLAEAAALVAFVESSESETRETGDMVNGRYAWTILATTSTPASFERSEGAGNAEIR